MRKYFLPFLVANLLIAGDYDNDGVNVNMGTCTLTLNGTGTVAGYYSSSVSSLTFTFTPSVSSFHTDGSSGIVKKATVVYYIGTGNPSDLTEANFAMKNGRTTIDDQTYEGFVSISHDDGSGTTPWTKSNGFTNSSSYSITITDDNLESALHLQVM